MRVIERRDHKRVAVRLNLRYKRVCGADAPGMPGHILNASVGGLYFMTHAWEGAVGDRLALGIVVPESSGVLEAGGLLNVVGIVCRLDEGRRLRTWRDGQVFGVAVRFVDVPCLDA